MVWYRKAIGVCECKCKYGCECQTDRGVFVSEIDRAGVNGRVLAVDSDSTPERIDRVVRTDNQ